MIERISIELSNACKKACWFCYSGSTAEGATRWTAEELVAFVTDCAANGVRAVSFGGGEPLDVPWVFEALDALRGTLFRSLTTNGLPLLAEEARDRLIASSPDKVHVSIHFPERASEVARVAEQVLELEARGVRSGVNLLVQRSKLDAARAASEALRARGIGPERVVYLPMRGQDTPTPEELARVAGTPRFQSMTCLAACAKSPRFASIGWDRTLAWCSYTTERAQLTAPTHQALVAALSGLGVTYCGGSDERLVRLSRRPLDGHDVVRGGP